MVVGMTSFLLIDLIAFANTGWSAWLLVGTGLLAAAVTIVMRRHPLPGLVLLAGVSLVISFGSLATRVVLGLELVSPGFGEVAGIAILASEVARRLPTTQVIFGVGSAYAVTAFSVVLRDPSSPGVVALFWLVLTVAVVMGIALRWTESSRQLTVDAARREERLSIARELHDSVAHHVTGIVVQAQAAREVGGTNLEAVQTALTSIEESGQATLRSMRRLVGALRSDGASDPLAPTAGLDELDTLIAQSRRQDDFGIVVDMDTDAIPAAVAPSVYRIVQESLTNVRRHGMDVTRVEVSVRSQDGGIQVLVVDDGHALERPANRGFGLSGMEERVVALGGQFWAGPRPGGGWAVTAWIPTDE